MSWTDVVLTVLAVAFFLYVGIVIAAAVRAVNDDDVIARASGQDDFSAPEGGEQR